MAMVYISLGSNLGDRESFLENARKYLSEQVVISKVSALLDNQAILFEDQPNFLNQVVVGDTSLSPEDLLTFVKETETRVGRIPRFRFGPREIDIDILFYEGETRNTPTLQLPHPGLTEREYLRILMADLSIHL